MKLSIGSWDGTFIENSSLLEIEDNSLKYQRLFGLHVEGVRPLVVMVEAQPIIHTWIQIKGTTLSNLEGVFK